MERIDEISELELTPNIQRNIEAMNLAISYEMLMARIAQPTPPVDKKRKRTEEIELRRFEKKYMKY